MRQHRTGALLLCLALLAGLVPARAAEDPNTVTITSPEELQALAQRCILDSASRGLTVELEADLELSGGFTLPVFCGAFHGNGHTITLGSRERGSRQGFFRSLQPGALVEELNLTITLTPEGSRSSVGGLAGENEGMIRNCTVSGAVTGETDVGGIAGVNLSSGVIEGCTNRAKITGTAQTGGIAGRNEGYLSGCVNEGAVNPSAGDQEENTSDSGLLDATIKEAYSNTGGIAGQSTGTIEGCINQGEIGYPHVGYNTGGIAGIQNGTVQNCINEGQVYGRKDVGGIVGQFEPVTATTYGQDPILQLDSALAALPALFTQLVRDANGSVDSALASLEAVNSALEVVQDVVHTETGAGREDAQALFDSLYADAQTVNNAMDGLLAALDSFSGPASADIRESLEAVGELRQGVSHALMNAGDGGGEAVAAVNDSMEQIDLRTRDISSSIDHISAFLDLYRALAKAVPRILAGVYDEVDPPTMDNPEPGGGDKLHPVRIRVRIEDLQALLEDYHSRYTRCQDTNGRDIQAELAHIREQTTALTEDLHRLTEELEQIYNTTAGGIDISIEEVNRAANRLELLAGHLNDAAKTLSDSTTSQLGVVNQQASRMERTIKNWSTAADDRLSDASERINRELKTINSSIQALTADASRNNDTLQATTDDIIRQLDTVREAANSITEPPERTVSDISDTGGMAGGQIFGCQNSGSIQGDANVGGIVGIMAPELLEDPEQDLDLDWGEDRLLVDVTVFLQAAVRACTGTGEVVARNDCAGGIAGRCEVGAVTDCVSQCVVSSTDGGTCGGIVGLSHAVIRTCAAQCDLSGGDSLGGIAGQGKDIQDCRAMTRIDSTGERLGAVAGDADGVLQNNYFLEEGLGGLDGVNYEGQALPLSFEEFSALSGVPAEFLTFAVTFQADGEEVAVLPVEYRGSLSPAEFPAVPEHGGDYGAWEEFSYEEITRNTTVHAVYSGWVTALSSGGAHPALLAEGAFSPEAVLMADPWTPELSLPAGYRLAAGYTYRITDTAPLPEQILLRVSTQGVEGNTAVAVLEGEELVTVETSTDGSYLLLPAGPAGAVVLLEQPTGPLFLLIGCAGVVLAAALILLVVHIRRHKKDGGTPPQTAPKEPPEEKTGEERT